MKIKRYFSLSDALDINHYRVIHSLKTALACFIGLGIEKYYNWPSGEWLPITILVVMSAQTHFGGAVHKALMRFLGTFLGLFIAVTALWFFGDNILMIFAVVFFASIIFSYIASSHGDISYAGTLGGVTVFVVLTTKNVGMELAFQRGSYIVVGIIIALLVSRFVFPIHARDRFRYHVAITLRNLAKFYLLAISVDGSLKKEKESENKSVKLNLKIIDDVVSQSRLIHEAVVGSRDFAAKRDTFNEVLNSEHSLNRLINLMYVNLREASSTVNVEKELFAVKKLHNIIYEDLRYLADCFEHIREPEKMVNFDEVLQDIAHAIEKMPKLSGAHQLIMGHSFLFFMEQILKELEKLRELIVKVNRKSKDIVV